MVFTIEQKLIVFKKMTKDVLVAKSEMGVGVTTLKNWRKKESQRSGSFFVDDR